MLPRNFSARIVLISCAVILAVVSIHFSDNVSAGPTGYLAYCASSSNDSAVYVTQIFDTGLNLNLYYDSNPIQNEYNEYVKGRFDLQSNSNLAVNCPLFVTASQAQTSRQNYESQMRQGNKQVVEVEWTYRPERPGAVVSVGRPGHTATGGLISQADHTFCISDAYQNTVYFTGPVATPPPVTMSSWINGFTQHLKGKYSFSGRVNCNMGTSASAQRLVDAHLDGSRAAGRRVVDTGWKYDAAQVTSASASRPADQDDDRQPAQRPAAQPPNLQARDLVVKETPRVTAYCVSDRVMAAAFDCDCLRRQVSTYRLNHVNDTLSASPTPLEELFKGDRFDCKSCIQVDWKFKPAVRGVAHLPGTSEAVRDCVVERFRSLLQSKPYPSQARELLNEAIKGCK